MRLSDQVADKLQHLIQEKSLKPGDRLPSERALAEQLGVSRPPIREAIQMLASQGILVTRPGGGTYVQSDVMAWPSRSMTPLSGLMREDPHYRYDVLEARHALEGSTAWHAALRATPQDKDNIQRCFELMVRHQQSGDAELSARADAQFHLAIAEASHNIVLLQVMHGLFEVVLSTVTQNRTIFRLNTPEDTTMLTTQHQRLVQAILEGNADQARDVMQQHLEYVERTIRTADDDQARQRRATRLASSRTLP